MTTQKSNKREFWVCGLLMCAGILAFHAFYFNSVLPVSEGWGIYYVELMERGQFPYRDFYYYLPPLNLLIDWLFWKLSFGSMLMFRGWYLIQRLALVGMLYCLLCKKFQPRFVWIACLTGACLGASSRYDLVGDYNQTQSMLIVGLAYVITAFLEQDTDTAGKKLPTDKYMFFAGLLLALMLLLKQSLGLAAVMVCFVFLIIYCAVLKDSRFGWYCLSTAAGALIPLILSVGVLLLNGAVDDFLTQFFGVAGAKGGIITILTAVIRNAAIERNYLYIFVCTVVIVLCVRKLLSGKSKIALISLLISACALVAVVCVQFGLAIKTAMGYFLTNPTLFLTVAVPVLLLVACVVVERRRPENLLSKNSRLLTVLLFVCIFVLTYFDVTGAYSLLYYNTWVFSDMTAVINYLSCYSIAAGLIYCFVRYKLSGVFPYPKPMIALFVCGLVDWYTCSMASGGYPIPRMMFTIVPVFLVYVFSFHFPKPNWDYAKNLLVCFLCVALCGVCMIQKYVGAYSWWGTGDGTGRMYQLNERTQSVAVEGLEGFRLSEHQQLQYEQVTRLIEENGDADSTVWGFPHVKIFNILTDHYNVDDPAPVLFYDVCSDEMALQARDWLAENNPEFVIWCDIPLCMEAHEHAFRNDEPLGQRQIVSWFASVCEEKYTHIGQIGNLFVYKLNDGSPIRYTYIEDPDVKNETLEEAIG